MTDTPSCLPSASPAHSGVSDIPQAHAKEVARRVREADALRANLRRRKEQLRARAGATASDAPAPVSPGASPPSLD